MKHHAKAPSAGSIEGNGNSRSLFRRALATRAAFGRAKGSGAPSFRAVAVFVAIVAALLAIAAPASAAPVAAEMGTVSNVSYASAHATGKLKGLTNNGFTAYEFQVSTDGDNWTTGAANLIVANGEPSVDLELTGLKGATTYFVRLFVSAPAGEATSPSPYPQFTTLPVDPPSVLASDNASDVAYTTAEAKGEVQRPANPASPPFDPNPAFNTKCTFEYITDAQFEENVNVNALPGFAGATPVDCDQPNPLEAPGASPVGAKLTGLAPATTYHLRLSASNAGGTDSKAAASTFTTLGPIPAPTVLTTDNASEVFYTTAEAKGKVKRPGNGPGGADPALNTECRFEYITDAQFEENVNVNALSGFEGATPIPCEQGPFTNPGEEPNVSAKLTGLAPATTYHLRLSASNAGGTDSEAAAATFATEAVAKPTIALDPITTHTGITAKFTAMVDTNAPAVLTPAAEVAFETAWSITCSPACPNLTPGNGAGTVTATEGSKAFSIDAAGLEPATSYEVTLEAINIGGPVTDKKSFATTEIPPTIKTAPGASDGNAGYILQGIVNPRNSVVECRFVYGPNSAAEPGDYAFAVPCSPVPGKVNKPVTVEGHVTGLTAGATYHSRLVVTNGVTTELTDDQIFVPTLDLPQSCPNEELRKESSSLALPECRAYEMVSDPSKGGFSADLGPFTEDGSSVVYASKAGNIANSGQGALGGQNFYLTERTEAGWRTVPGLNGPSGSLYAPPYELTFPFASPATYSSDLHSSLWFTELGGVAITDNRVYLRKPDGSFTLVGNGNNGPGAFGLKGKNWVDSRLLVGTSGDLSRVVFNGVHPAGYGTVFGPGVYEFVGTGNEQPKRIDVDNSGDPVSACVAYDELGGFELGNAKGRSLSHDGSRIVFTVYGGCGGANPPADELWVRVGGTTSFNASASLCTRVDCNEPAGASFQGMAADGSRIFFTTTQQLLDGDTDQTNDLYACDIPSGSPAPTGTANPCSSLSQVSGAANGADVENVTRISEDGTSAYFVAPGVLAANSGALEETATPGNHNLYAWRKDAAHPAGETTFLARLGNSDVSGQVTPDGRFLIFTTANQLVPTDTDEGRDVYRYDADAGQLTRVSTNVFGVAGNGDGFDARIDAGNAASDDGDSVVFVTEEALSPFDGNGTMDVYLWKAGKVSLISTGSVGSGGFYTQAAINGSGKDIFFTTAQQLTPSDGDTVEDIYNARIGGGFSFAPSQQCSGEACQPPVSGSPPAPAPITGQPSADAGNVKPKQCLKGKVAKGSKCVKKPHKKKGKGHAKRAGRNRGGSK